MGLANLDLVRSIYADWERGDFSRARSEWVDPDIELVVVDGPRPGTWTGMLGLEEAWRDWTDAWADFHADADECRELDDERVLVLIRRSGRGKASGVELGQVRTHGAAVYHLRDGKVTRIVNYFDRKLAFAELGLPPEGGAADSP